MDAAVTPAVARAHVVVAELTGDRLALTGDDHHHLSRVLRLPPGATVTATDGLGRWRPYRLGRARTDLEPLGPVVVEQHPDPVLAIAFAPMKGGHAEWVVQKLTELGVDRIVPFVAARSVVRWTSARVARQEVRLAQIARQATMQCRRTWMPIVEPMATFARAASLPGAALADRRGDPPSLRHTTLLVGPEGGWDDAEQNAGLAAVRLAPHTLRAETAAVTAGALMVALRSGLVAAAASRKPHAP